MTRQTLIPLGLALFVFQARTAEKFPLTVDNIMRGPALVGYEPSQIRWSYDNQHIYFQWKQASDKPDAPLDTYVVGRDGSPPHKLSDEEAKQAPPAFGDVSGTSGSPFFRRGGDLFLYDSANGRVRQITNTAEAETDPHFLPDGKRIFFTRGGNLYVMSLDTGYLEQMTDIRAAGAPPPAAPTAFTGGFGGRGGRGGAPPPEPPADQKPASASQESLKKEQKELFETVRDRAARREEAEARRKREQPRKPFTLEARQSVAEVQLSPDGKYAIATLVEPSSARNTTVPQWITDSAYTENSIGRSNVGDTQSHTRLAVFDAVSGEMKWVDHGEKAASAAPQPAPPSSGAEQGGRGPHAGEPKEREIELAMPVWSEDGSKAALLGRSADNKDRWIFALDAAAGKTRVLAHDHDDAWIDGPGAFTLGWMKNGREVYFQSERTGYSHLYAVAWDGGEPRALTSGNWEVLAARQSRDKSHFYITASKDSPYENHLYEMSGEGGDADPPHRPAGQAHHYAVARRAVDRRYLLLHQPAAGTLRAGEPAAGRADNASPHRPRPSFRQYPWLDAPIVTFTARDGVKVPARLFKPANFRKGGPARGVRAWRRAICRTWTAGGRANYYREYLFDHLLMERGFIVIDVDYRGSAGYGRDWRTAIYEHMGGKDLDDIVDAARYLVAQHGVDPNKIGLWGGSYGGFITLMAMFTQPRHLRRRRGAAAGFGLGALQSRLHFGHPESAAERRRKPIGGRRRSSSRRG